MTKKLTDLENRIEVLQSEESIIENRKTHQGFRDASSRNRIEEQLEVLHEELRRDHLRSLRPSSLAATNMLVHPQHQEDHQTGNEGHV